MSINTLGQTETLAAQAMQMSAGNSRTVIWNEDTLLGTAHQTPGSAAVLALGKAMVTDRLVVAEHDAITDIIFDTAALGPKGLSKAVEILGSHSDRPEVLESVQQRMAGYIQDDRDKWLPVFFELTSGNMTLRPALHKEAANIGVYLAPASDNRFLAFNLREDIEEKSPFVLTAHGRPASIPTVVARWSEAGDELVRQGLIVDLIQQTVQAVAFDQSASKSCLTGHDINRIAIQLEKAASTLPEAVVPAEVRAFIQAHSPRPA